MTYHYVIRCIQGNQFGEIGAATAEDAAEAVIALAQFAPRGTLYEVRRVANAPRGEGV